MGFVDVIIGSSVAYGVVRLFMGPGTAWPMIVGLANAASGVLSIGTKFIAPWPAGGSKTPDQTRMVASAAAAVLTGAFTFYLIGLQSPGTSTFAKSGWAITFLLQTLLNTGRQD